MRRAWRVCLLIVLSGAGQQAVATPPANNYSLDQDPTLRALPSIELLEYLAEFEAAADGTLMDPVDLQQHGTQRDAAPGDEPWSTQR